MIKAKTNKRKMYFSSALVSLEIDRISGIKATPGIDVKQPQDIIILIG